jgi:hypothetical protein
MPRSALLVVAAIALVAGCRPAADAEPLGSPGGRAAGAARTEVDGAPARPESARSDSDEAGRASSPVAVAKLDHDAGPCERACGSLGDCLLAAEDYSSAVAGRIELECLDLCVYAPDEHASKRELIACSERSCPELAACAERNWAGLEAASQALDLSVAVVDSDPCIESCRSLWSCLASGQPFGGVQLDPDSQHELDTNCVLTCESAGEREIMAKVWPCVKDRCNDRDGIYECWFAVNP